MSELTYQAPLPLLLILILVNLPFLEKPALAGTSLKRMLPRAVETVAKYTPPDNLGAPPTVGGATRGGQCKGDELTKPGLTVLTPDLKTEEAEWSQTVSDAPKFLIYLPPTSAQMAEFVLKDESENDLYRTTFPITGEPGIVIFKLPATMQLAINTNYHWYFSLICDPDNLRENVEADSWTRRVELDSNLATYLELDKATALERSNLYAQAGIWQEALSTLAQLYQENPNDETIASEWKILLESAGLNTLVEMPANFMVIEGTP